MTNYKDLSNKSKGIPMTSKEKKVQMLTAFAKGELTLEEIDLARREAQGEIIVAYSFYDLLRLTGIKDQSPAELNKIVLAPGEFKSFLQQL